MKKIFFSLLAIGAIASCAKTEDFFVEENSEIKLAPVAALQTKANYLGAVDGTVYPVAENFDVYAYYKNVLAGETFTDGQVFLTAGNSGVEFVNKGNYWGGAQNYYWPKNGSLRFAAYSPASVDMYHQQENDFYYVDDYVQPHETANTWDLLVAPTSPSYSLMTATEKVAVKFQHALSWITLKVMAKDADAAKVFDIKEVIINDVMTKADFGASMTNGIQYDEWKNQEVAEDYVVFTGSQMVTETAKDIETSKAGTLVIPQATTSVTVKFTQKGLNGTPTVDGMELTLDLVLDDNAPWNPGKHYVYTLVFGLDKILINPSVADWEDVTANDREVGENNIYTAEELADALTADVENIKVVLQKDIDLPISSLGQQTGGSGEYKLGGERTQNITIDLNGKKLNLTTDYMSKLGAKNANALFTIKNGKMTSSKAEGTWNIYDLTFANCDYEIENVEFLKAIAFDNANKSVALKNVTIKETHDYYAMWICAAGQNVTIDGLTVVSSGRGIKIDEQYVNESLAHVNLNISNATFETANKAAILVKSAAGATINLDNVNIKEVAADTDFAVWVDADAAAYADKVVVNGGLCKVEGATASVADTLEELKTGLSAENATVYLKPTEDGKSIELGGKISIAKGASLIGLGDEPVGVDNDWGSTTFPEQAHFTNTHIENIFFDDNMVIDAGIANGNVTFKDCVFGGHLAHQGVHFDSGNGVVIFDNCTFVGRNMLGSSLEKVIFNNCTFLNKKSSLTGADKWTGVNMWGKYEFNNCVFDTEAHCNVKCDGVVAAFNDCSFVDSREVTSVIWNGAKYDATLTFNGKTYAAEGLVVDANGNAIASTEAGLKEALKNGATVILDNPFTIDPSESNGYGKTGINMTNGGTLDGNGNELGAPGSTGTWDSAINTSGGTIKNIKITKGFRGVFIKNDANHNEKLYLDNVTIDGTTYTISCDEGNGLGLEATNSTFKGWTSYADTLGEAKFLNCSFGKGNGYAYCRPYAPTEFVRCDFEAGFKVDPVAVVTFRDCTIGGSPLTAENLATLVTGNIANASVQ